MAIVRGPGDDVLIADGPQGAIWRLKLPAGSGSGWRPARTAMAAEALRALEEGDTFTRELLEKERRDRESMAMSMRWRVTGPLVRLYEALGRPLD